jgi:polyisoprenyl-teichoic acid--peptidoglycan teichoic acid transferase
MLTHSMTSLSEQSVEIPVSKKSYKKRLRMIFRLLIIVCIVVVIVYVSKFTVSIIKTLHSFGITSSTISQFVLNDPSILRDYNKKINILVLGIRGGDREASDLTDTMVLLSLTSPIEATHSIQLLSIPRDLWSQSMKDKINSAYHYGEEKQKGNGMIYTKSMLEEIIGFPIQYVVLIDFDGFIRLIDVIGGIHVDVQHPFIDKNYPIEGKETDTCKGDSFLACRYETVTFDRGLQIMDGKRALQYVRSRYADSKEGTDFSRNQRQQEIILAIIAKIKNPSFYLYPSHISAVLNALPSLVTSTMTLGEVAILLRSYAQYDWSNVQRLSMNEDVMEGNPFYYDERYVLIPTHSWSDLSQTIYEKIYSVN